MFEPRPALFELSETETPFEADTAKNTGLSFPSAPSQRAIFPRGTGCQLFPSCLLLHVARVKFAASVAEKWELLFFFLPNPHS